MLKPHATRPSQASLQSSSYNRTDGWRESREATRHILTAWSGRLLTERRRLGFVALLGWMITTYEVESRWDRGRERWSAEIGSGKPVKM